MYKYLSTIVVMFLLILTLSACSGGSNSTSDSSTNNTKDNSTTTESTTTQDTATDNTATDNTSNGTTATNSNLVGDWKFVGDVNESNYEITLDLESNGTYSLDVEDTTKDEVEDSELDGTYTSTDSVLSLTAATVNDNNQYFNGAVVTDSVVDLNYTLDGNTLTLKNANDVIGILPSDLILARDD